MTGNYDQQAPDHRERTNRISHFGKVVSRHATCRDTSGFRIPQGIIIK